MAFLFILFLHFQMGEAANCTSQNVNTIAHAKRCYPQDSDLQKEKVHHYYQVLYRQNLAPSEIESIQSYILGLSDKLNRALWEGKMDSNLELKRNLLEKALDKISSESRLLHRGLKLPLTVIGQYRKGAKIKWKGLTSLSLKFNLFFVDNVRFFVLTRNAKAVWPISPHREEFEYLLKSGTMIRVKDHQVKFYKELKKEVHEILVEEI